MRLAGATEVCRTGQGSKHRLHSARLMWIHKDTGPVQHMSWWPTVCLWFQTLTLLLFLFLVVFTSKFSVIFVLPPSEFSLCSRVPCFMSLCSLCLHSHCVKCLVLCAVFSVLLPPSLVICDYSLLYKPCLSLCPSSRRTLSVLCVIAVLPVFQFVRFEFLTSSLRFCVFTLSVLPFVWALRLGPHPACHDMSNWRKAKLICSNYVYDLNVSHWSSYPRLPWTFCGGDISFYNCWYTDLGYSYYHDYTVLVSFRSMRDML